MTEVTIEDVQSFIRNKARIPIMTVDSIDSADYNSMREFVLAVKPNAEDYTHSITTGMNSLLSSMRHMNREDYNTIVNTFKKYEIKGTSSGISGDRTYGYDKSRIDGKLIRRRRAN
tara:strand:+ start:802 stop:1149 length:348 start_codon:yes stop_codon:yes gene_type:complete